MPACVSDTRRRARCGVRGDRRLPRPGKGARPGIEVSREEPRGVVPVGGVRDTARPQDAGMREEVHDHRVRDAAQSDRTAAHTTVTRKQRNSHRTQAVGDPGLRTPRRTPLRPGDRLPVGPRPNRSCGHRPTTTSAPPSTRPAMRQVGQMPGPTLEFPAGPRRNGEASDSCYRKSGAASACGLGAPESAPVPGTPADSPDRPVRAHCVRRLRPSFRLPQGFGPGGLLPERLSSPRSPTFPRKV